MVLKICIHMGFVYSIVSMATHNATYGNGKIPTSIKHIISLIVVHAATNILYLNLVILESGQLKIRNFEILYYWVG